MKKFLKATWEKFQRQSPFVKALFAFLFIFYIGIITICIVPLDVDATTPGEINQPVGLTNLTNKKLLMIDTEPNLSEREEGYNDIYSVCVYSRKKMSIFEYLVMKQDKYTNVEYGKSNEDKIFRDDEEYLTGVGQKIQSIQASVMLSYKQAMKDKENGIETKIDYKLDYKYSGEYLIYLPNDLLNDYTLKNGDIVTHYGDKEINKDLPDVLNEIFENHKYQGKSIKEWIADLKVNKEKDHDKEGERIKKLLKEINEELKDKYPDKKFKVKRNVYEQRLFLDKEGSFVVEEVTPSLKMLLYLASHLVVYNKDDKDQLFRINKNMFSYYDIKYDNAVPKITINKNNTIGPSAGLMQTLAIYNAITEKDWVKGWRFVGTGEISEDGKAGNIGGVKQKVATADLFKADYFIVPEGNYYDAVQKYDELKKKDKKMGIRHDIVPVASFEGLLEFIDSLPERERRAWKEGYDGWS